MMNINEIIDGGSVELCSVVLNKIADREIDYVQELMDSLLHNYLVKGTDGSTSLTYWQTVASQKGIELDRFNELLALLDREGYVTTSVVPARNWAEIKLNASELKDIELRKEFLISKHIMRLDNSEAIVNLSKWGNTFKDTGLARRGSAKASKNAFGLDFSTVDYSAISMEVLTKNLVKSMDKMLSKNDKLVLKEINYKDLAISILNIYMLNGPKTLYNSEQNMHDSRGRAIKKVMKRVFNYISNKDARAMLVIPQKRRKPMTKDGNKRRYLAIAELLGLKEPTLKEKISAGWKAYQQRKLLDLNPQDEHDRSEWHVNIWLERIYRDLYSYEQNKDYKAECPIEIDCTASMLQVQGALFNHKPFIRGTNMNVGKKGKLRDMWHHKHIKREPFKTAMTQMLYGSSKGVTKIWNEKGFKVKDKQILYFNQEIRAGKMALANEFKNFIIKNVNPSVVMNPVINGESFEVQCNKFKDTAEFLKLHKLYDSKTGLIKTIQQSKTKKVPDLKQFNRFFVTLFIHNLDSQVADYVCDSNYWVLDIYDAFICNAEDAEPLAQRLCEKLDTIKDNGPQIIEEYLKSISIDIKEPHMARKWKRVTSKIEDAGNNWRCQTTALK